MLDVNSLSCSLPGHGTVLDDVTFTAATGTITAVVGRSHSGADTLLAALAGVLPPGARSRGSAVLNGARIDGATPDELAEVVLWVSDAALPGGTVADILRSRLGDLSAADELGLQDDLSRRLSSLPIDMRLRLHCATLMAQDISAPPALILVDRVLGTADVTTRDHFCSLLGGLARAGATVVWAEHDLDAVWEHAHRLMELVDGKLVSAVLPQEWQPSSLPEPTLLTMARALDLPPKGCRTPLMTRETLEEYHIVLPLLPTRTHDGSAPTGTGRVIDASAVGLSGRGIEIRPRETVGIIALDGRPEALTRALVAQLPGGGVVPSQLPPSLVLGAAARTWEIQHDLAAGSVMRRVPRLHPRTLVAALSPDELATFRLALADGVETALWLPHPQAWLDPRERHTLAEDLRRRPAGTRLITSRDVEFLVRACHRLVVVQDDRVVGDGSPGAVADLLPTTPLVSRAVGSTRYLRLTDVLESTRTGVTV